MTKYIFFIFIIILFGCKSSSYISYNKKIHHFTDSFLQDKQLSDAQIGIYIIDEKLQKTIVAYQPKKNFIPASNVKLFTCFTALKYLKDSLPGFYIFENKDSLFIQPNCDPSFLLPNFAYHTLIEKIKNTEKQIVFIYDSVKINSIPKYGYGWAWEDYNTDYMSELCAFPINRNLVDFTLIENNLKIYPTYFSNKIGDEKIKNTFYGNEFLIDRDWQSNQFIFKKSIKPFLKSSVPFTHSKLYETELNILQQIFINKKFVAIPNYNANHILLKPFNTILLDSILKIMMYESDNFFAEQLLYMSSNNYQNNYDLPSFLSNILEKEYPFLTTKPKWVDGSGLSRYNLFTPTQMVELLVQLKKEVDWQKLTHILEHGDVGTLKKLYTKYPYRIYAKTGTLTNNMALSGFIITLKNTILPFSIMVGNYKATNKKVRQSIEILLNNIIENYPL